jgi:hypothetical protein
MNSKRPVAAGKKAVSDNWNWTLSKLKREDWDFRPEVCREDELAGCWFYEFSREVAAFRNAVADSRKRNPDYVAKFNSLSQIPATKSSSRPVRISDALMAHFSKPPVPLAYRIHPQWPDTPFGQLGKTPHKQAHNWTFFYLQKDIGEFARQLIARPGFPNLPKTLWDEEGMSETVIFTIPWLYSNDQLKKGFDQWLTDNRPQGNEGDSRPKVQGRKKPTGRASEPCQQRADLKALGAYRLLCCYKGKRQFAMVHSQNGYDVIKALGKDFDKNESAWTDAKKRALNKIEYISKIREGDLKLEAIRLRWETDKKFRQNYPMTLRFIGKGDKAKKI